MGVIVFEWHVDRTASRNYRCLFALERYWICWFDWNWRYIRCRPNSE